MELRITAREQFGGIIWFSVVCDNGRPAKGGKMVLQRWRWHFGEWTQLYP